MKTTKIQDSSNIEIEDKAIKKKTIAMMRENKTSFLHNEKMFRLKSFFPLRGVTLVTIIQPTS